MIDLLSQTSQEEYDEKRIIKKNIKKYLFQQVFFKFMILVSVDLRIKFVVTLVQHLKIQIEPNRLHRFWSNEYRVMY